MYLRRSLSRPPRVIPLDPLLEGNDSWEGLETPQGLSTEEAEKVYQEGGRFLSFVAGREQYEIAIYPENTIFSLLEEISQYIVRPALLLIIIDELPQDLLLGQVYPQAVAARLPVRLADPLPRVSRNDPRLSIFNNALEIYLA